MHRFGAHGNICRDIQAKTVKLDQQSKHNYDGPRFGAESMDSMLQE